jgi:hypothetical protein
MACRRGGIWWGEAPESSIVFAKNRPWGGRLISLGRLTRLAVGLSGAAMFGLGEKWWLDRSGGALIRKDPGCPRLGTGSGVARR